MRVTSCEIVVLPAPEWPTSATMWPAGTVKLTSCERVAVDLVAQGRDGLEGGQRDLVGARVAEADVVELDGRAVLLRPAARRSLASGFSATVGSRSSTSSTRSKLTSAVITSTWTLDIAVSGPYRRPR